MPDYLIKEETLTNIADAIRSETGTAAKIDPDDMDTAISNIVTLAEGTADATAVASDLLTGKTAYVNGNKITGSLNQGYSISTYTTLVNEACDNPNTGTSISNYPYKTLTNLTDGLYSIHGWVNSNSWPQISAIYLAKDSSECVDSNKISIIYNRRINTSGSAQYANSVHAMIEIKNGVAKDLFSNTQKTLTNNSLTIILYDNSSSNAASHLICVQKLS